jgi:hypothetical protein
LGEIKQWNLENDQKNADLTAVKAKATEEYLAQAAPSFDSKSFKYAKVPQKTLSESEKKALAVKEKDKGNEYFSKAQYPTAIEHYTEAIKYDATNTACFANRALCYIKTERWIKAIEDCNAVIKLDPNYVKAYLRRGLAYRHSKKLSLALLDFEKVLSLEPANKEAANELKAVKELLALEEQSQRKSNENTLDVSNKQSAGSMAKSPAPVLEKKSDLFLQQVKQEKKSANEVNNTAQHDRVVSTSSADKQDGHKKESTSVQEPSTSAAVTTVTPVKPSHDTTAVVPQKPTALPALIPTAVPDVAPKHYYEFERSWNSLKDDNKACYKYFKLIKPEAYPALFKEAMTSELLLSIWHLLRENSFPDDVDFAVHAMKSLPKLSRFDMLLLFLEKHEKQALDELWTKFAQANVDAKILSTIKAMYR